METESRFLVEGKQGVTWMLGSDKCPKIFVMMVVQLCEYSKNHLIIDFS